MEGETRAGRKPWPRIVVAILLAAVSSVVGFAFLWTGDCGSDTQCDVQGAVLLATLFGGWAVLAVAAVATAVLRVHRSRRVRWPLNVALAVLCVLPFTPSVYATFKDGVRGATAGGREDLHRDATRRMVSVVDSTVAAVLPGATPVVAASPGTREGNDTGTCQYVRYLVRLDVAPRDQPGVVDAVAERWRADGMEVRREDALGPSAYAEAGGVRFYFVRSVADRTGRTFEMGGSGPCLAT